MPHLEVLKLPTNARVMAPLQSSHRQSKAAMTTVVPSTAPTKLSLKAPATQTKISPKATTEQHAKHSETVDSKHSPSETVCVDNTSKQQPPQVVNNVNVPQDSKFIDRVLDAMRSSKRSTTPSTSSVQNANGQQQNNFNGFNELSKQNNGSSSSICSNATTISTTSSHKPPVPPQARAKVPKARAGSPMQSTALPTKTAAFKNTTLNSKQVLKHNNTYSSTNTSQTIDYDSDDGLQKNTPFSFSKTRHSSSQYSNGYSTSSSSSAFNSREKHKLSNGNAESVNESPLSVKLTLPILNSADAQQQLTGIGNSSSGYSSFRTKSSERTYSGLTNRSPSPALSLRSNASSNASRTSTAAANYSRLQTPPRRVFPQTYTRGDPLDAYEMRNLESSPVVFDANLSFVLGCKKQPVHQSLRASPSFEDSRTSSAYLSEKIQNFLKRTDHVQEEWSAMGRTRSRRSLNRSESRGATPTNSNSLYDDYDTISLIERQRDRNSMERAPSVGRSRSSQNILAKAFQLTKTLPRTPTSRSNSLAREMSVVTNDDRDDDDRTIHEEDDNIFDEVLLEFMQNTIEDTQNRKVLIIVKINVKISFCDENVVLVLNLFIFIYSD